jgi:hypothetical protein
MIEGMISDGMAVVNYLLEYLGMFSNVIADAKESCQCLIARKGMKCKLGRSGNGSIVKCQVDFLMMSGHSPYQRRIQQRKKERCAMNHEWLKRSRVYVWIKIVERDDSRYALLREALWRASRF